MRRRLALLLALLGLAVAAAVVWQSGFLDARVTLTWTTENSIDIAGFNIYRADEADGDRVQINPDLIPAGTDPFVSSEYTFVDDQGLRRGKTYHYWLETVDTLGGSSIEGPIAIPAR